MVPCRPASPTFARTAACPDPGFRGDCCACEASRSMHKHRREIIITRFMRATSDCIGRVSAVRRKKSPETKLPLYPHSVASGIVFGDSRLADDWGVTIERWLLRGAAGTARRRSCHPWRVGGDTANLVLLAREASSKQGKIAQIAETIDPWNIGGCG